MTPRSVRPVPLGTLQSLSAERLDAYRKKLHSLEEDAELSDLTPEEVEGLDPELIHFKSDPRWRQLHAEVLRLRGRASRQR